jgi:uncharacterized phage protein (TIGR01671 family)
MDRDIKFRAWDGKKMLVFNSHRFTSDYDLVFGEDITERHYIDTYFEGDQLKLMQYTGLKDKNGKEIYEGDIMSFLGENWVVEYFVSYASFVISKGNDLSNITTQEEVIGNIYEHKHLIDGN